MRNLFSQPSFQTITFAFMMNQRSSNEKQTNMCGTRLQVEVPCLQTTRARAAEDQIYRIYTADMRLCPTYKMELRMPKRRIPIIASLSLDCWLSQLKTLRIYTTLAALVLVVSYQYQVALPIVQKIVSLKGTTHNNHNQEHRNIFQYI